MPLQPAGLNMETIEKKVGRGRNPKSNEYYLGSVIYARLLDIGDYEEIPLNIERAILKTRMFRIAQNEFKHGRCDIRRKFLITEKDSKRIIIRTA